MGTWHEVGNGHTVQCLATAQAGEVTLLWEHDAVQPYGIARHMVSSKPGATWTLTETAAGITLSPSLHCDRALGGCGAHGHVREGAWV